jgi:GTP cyclohydrolase II
VLGSCKCDCRQQLDFALEAIDAEPRGGVVIYMQQARPAWRRRKLATRARGVKPISVHHATRTDITDG